MIEAVDSLNPFMHFKGVSFMVDLLHHRPFGKPQWAPRYDYSHAASGPHRAAGKARRGFGKVLGHPVHKALATASSMRPSVDIAVGG